MSSSNVRGKKVLANASNSREVPANASNRRKVPANASNRRKVPVNASNRRPSAVDSLPATFRLSLGPVASNSVAIDLEEISSPVVKSFNIWCSEENEDIFSKVPVSSFLCDQPRRVLISSLQPGTKYKIRAVAYGDKGEVGCSQAMCMTMTVDSNPPGPTVLEKEKNIQEGSCPSAGVERDCGGAEEAVREVNSPPTTHGRSLLPDLNEDDEPVRDLNEDVGPLPDLNEDVGPLPDMNEDGGAVSGLNEDYDRAEVPPTADANSALVDGPPSGGFEGKFGECVKMIGRLERNGHMETEFGMKFLTWFTQRSTAEQKQTVSVFIEALGDDEERLAKQLVDTFSGKISNKRLKK